jgi:hypothetical protein
VYELYHAGRLAQPVADAAVEAILAIQADPQQKQAWQSHESKWEYLVLMLDRDNRLSAEHWKRYVAAGGRTDPPGP